MNSYITSKAQEFASMPNFGISFPMDVSKCDNSNIMWLMCCD